MTDQELNLLRERLQSKVPLLGALLHANAAITLGRAHTPQACRVLAEHLVQEPDAGRRSRILVLLGRQEQQDCIDAICAVWAATRYGELSDLLRQHGWLAQRPESVRVLTLLHVGPLKLLQEGSVTLVPSLIAACTDREPPLAERARRVLGELIQEDARDGVCLQFLKEEQGFLRAAALAGHYEPRDYALRALFFFLTEQWDRYEALDFDHSLLRTAYEHADPGLRQRIAAQARSAGRVEWVEVVAGGRQGRRLGELTTHEWDAVIAVLHSGARGEDLWRMAQHAPLHATGRLVREIQALGWQPKNLTERDAWKTLAHLVAQCATEQPMLRDAFRVRRTFRGHTQAISAAALTPDGHWLLTASYDHTLRLHDLTSGQTRPAWTGHSEAILCLALSPSGKLAASGSRDNTIRLWSVPDGKLIDCLEGHHGDIQCLLFIGDHLLVSGSSDMTVQLWRLPEGVPERMLVEPSDRVQCLAIAPDGTTLAAGTAYKDARIHLWDLPGCDLHRAFKGHGSLVTTLAFTADGKYLVSGSYDKEVRIWDVATGRQSSNTGAMKHGGRVNCLAIHPQGRAVASGAGSEQAPGEADPVVHVWHLPSGRSIGQLSGHLRSVTCLTWLGQGKYLASGGMDGAIRIWQPDNPDFKEALHGHKGPVTSLLPSADGRHLVSVAEDGLARVWGLQPLVLPGLAIPQTTLEDLAWAEETRKERETTAEDRAWLDVLVHLMQWRRRFDIGLADAPHRLTVGEYDIEIESVP